MFVWESQNHHLFCVLTSNAWLNDKKHTFGEETRERCEKGEKKIWRGHEGRVVWHFKCHNNYYMAAIINKKWLISFKCISPKEPARIYKSGFGTMGQSVEILSFGSCLILFEMKTMV